MRDKEREVGERKEKEGEKENKLTYHTYLLIGLPCFFFSIFLYIIEFISIIFFHTNNMHICLSKETNSGLQ